MGDASISAVLFVKSILIFVILCIWIHIKREKLYRIAEQYNGPKPLPIIGNILKLLVPLTDISNVMLKATSYYKSPARIWIGPYLAIAIWDPESIKIVLNNSHALRKQPHVYKLVEAISGRGLVTSPVEEWKRHRKLIAPVFKLKYLESFFDIFLAHSQILVDNLQNRVNKGIFDVRNYVADYAVSTLFDSALNFGDEKDARDTSLFKDFISSMFHGIALRITKIWYISDFIFNMSSTGRKFNETKKNYNMFITPLIEKCTEDSKRISVQSKKPFTGSGTGKPRRLIEHMASVSDGRGKLTPEEIKGEINTIVVAGLETTSSALGNVLIALGMHPEIQERVYQEIIQVLGIKKQLQYGNVKDLVYMERVIKESMRILPTSVGIARCNDEDIQLEHHVIPHNSIILIGIQALHKDPKIWPNPTKFDPDRFLPEIEAKRHLYSWLPFSAGPRGCLGMRYALMSLKIALVTFLLNYKVTTDYKNIDEVKLTMNILYEPTFGYRVGITTRHDITNCRN